MPGERKKNLYKVEFLISSIAGQPQYHEVGQFPSYRKIGEYLNITTDSAKNICVRKQKKKFCNVRITKL